ncbi:hypothetical protein [Nonomuraea jiangxiensis]|uniref:Uncharacterized protein n=1 Tax=Nonomuraea jiangxiensis TaxID=633440 RepID=A0A1G8W501_9ACTN|nr:hypothetical protein [Nonomuraea jiangxiensis]SDJ73401.1 hypothetical protein SAMN05421869_11254 [Nonomuraea jiangxiensis]
MTLRRWDPFHRAARPAARSGARSAARSVARPFARPVVARAALLVALCVALPAGAAAVVALRAERGSYAATHHQVVAQVMDERAVVARVTWDGGRRSGWARRPLERVSDTAVRIWLDDLGRPASRPVGAVEVVFGFLLAALPAGTLTWLAVPALYAWWTARRAVARWDREWRDHRYPG